MEFLYENRNDSDPSEISIISVESGELIARISGPMSMLIAGILLLDPSTMDPEAPHIQMRKAADKLSRDRKHLGNPDPQSPDYEGH